MSKLVKHLQQNHDVILNRFQLVKRLGIHTMEGRNQLMESRSQLLRHLDTNRKLFCSQLRNDFRRDPVLLEVIESFELGTQILLEFCREFFEKYAQGGGGVDFFKDFARLKSSFEHQLRREQYFLRRSM